jgi:hypothetical protein
MGSEVKLDELAEFNLEQSLPGSTYNDLGKDGPFGKG